MLLDRFSPRTVDSGPSLDHFECFGHDLNIRSGPILVQKPGKPILAFGRHDFLDFQEMPNISSGQPGKKFWNGAQKKVPKSSGLVGVFGPSLA